MGDAWGLRGGGRGRGGRGIGERGGAWGDDRGSNEFRGRGVGRGGGNLTVDRGMVQTERPGPAPAVCEPQFQEHRVEVKVEAPATEEGGGDESGDSKRSRNGMSMKQEEGDKRRERHIHRSSHGGEGGRRGARREKFTPVERMDVVVSKPSSYTGDTGKRGKSGQPTDLMGNFFALQTQTNWCIFNYRVDFNPDEERTHVKKALLKPHAASIGAYIFDGFSLYVAQRLHPDPMKLYSIRETDKEKVELTVRLVQQLVPGDPMYLQFFNITVRKCLSAMKLEELGRHFYDREQGIKMVALKLELWPGYITSLRNYENNVLLCVDVTHKVLRQENVLNIIAQMRGNQHSLGPSLKKSITDELVGTIVMTHYNRKTYRIDDIDWDCTPASTFDMRGEKISYVDYYRQRYKQTVSDMHQPMLVSRPKKRDFHRGMTGPIILVPEFCQMTGLSDAMRSNFTMMKQLSQHLHMEPRSRMDAISNFMKRLKSTPEVEEDLQRWGLKFSKDLVSFKGRVLPGEQISLGENLSEIPNKQADWTTAFRSKPLLHTKDLESWVIIVPSRDASGVDNLLGVMEQVSRPLKFNISKPKEIKTLPNTHIQNYVKEIDQAVANYEKRGDLQLIFVILPNNKLDTYAAVKRRCIVDYGITSQCFLAKNMQAKAKQLMTIATKCVVQMSVKLGGEPWQIQNPFKSSQAMVVGFDVYHCGKRTGASVGAMVATTSPNLAKHYSTVSFHHQREELSSNICQDIAKCIHAYEEINCALPRRIIMYRDGVGEGQLSYVYGTELEQIKIALKALYSARNHPLPKFTFIIVEKKLNTRIFTSQDSSHGADNPKPGTIVDDVITLPERFDFYLISQFGKLGTVSPTAYNVLHDEQGLTPDHIQRFTYKMCHLYFNWSGTVGVPAPCQYAHKLAYLTGLALGNVPSERLSHQLYYL